MGQKQVLTTPGRYKQIQKICQFIIQGARQAGMDDTTIFHIELACDEACTNIIEHAYGGEGLGDIVASYEVQETQFVIILQDHGRSFDPASVPQPSLTTNLTSDNPLENIQIGGLGLHFMRKLMDEVHFHSDKQEGNTLIMTKKRNRG